MEGLPVESAFEDLPVLASGSREGDRTICFFSVSIPSLSASEIKQNHNSQHRCSVLTSAYRKPAFQPSAVRRLFIGFQPSAENQPISMEKAGKFYKCFSKVGGKF